jgi:gas vesicle protein
MGAVLGAFLGSVAAMMLTPKTGKEMRALLKDYAENWEDETGELSQQARDVINALLTALDDNTAELRHEAPAIVADLAHQAASTATTVSQNYQDTKESVGEMVETFKSQWQELEETAPLRPVAHSRYRPVHQSWGTATLKADQQENQTYVESLQTAEPEPILESAESRPTLAEYRRRAQTEPEPTLTPRPSTEPVAAKPKEEKEDKAPSRKSEAEPKADKKPASRKLFFKRS